MPKPQTKSHQLSIWVEISNVFKTNKTRRFSIKQVQDLCPSGHPDTVRKTLVRMEQNGFLASSSEHHNYKYYCLASEPSSTPTTRYLPRRPKKKMVSADPFLCPDLGGYRREALRYYAKKYNEALAKLKALQLIPDAMKEKDARVRIDGLGVKQNG